MENDLELQLTNLLGETILRVEPLAGGDISEAFLLWLQNKKVFCKLNYSQNAYSMFSGEREGLKLISDSAAIKTPEVLGSSELKNGACLLMEYIEPGQATTKDLLKLGYQLAELHLCSADKYGLEMDNYIGSLPQSNTKHSSWASFYTYERLQPQLLLAIANKLLSADDVPEVQIIENTIENFTSDAKPALLHGDLWRGNYLISSNGDPYLIDPAVYYGDSEVDLAMTKLFGGFGPEFYKAYYEIIPTADGYSQRVDLYQLYYLLVHLNLFGSSYYPAVTKIMSRYF